MLMAIGRVVPNVIGLNGYLRWLYQAASGAGANNMREFIRGMGYPWFYVADWTGSITQLGAILEIDRKVAELST